MRERKRALPHSASGKRGRALGLCPCAQPRAPIEAIEARLRQAQVGLARVDLPEPPVYSNDAAVEAQRSAEHAALVARCHVQAAAWNAEAHRWHVERADVAAALFRVEANASTFSGRLAHSHAASSASGSGDRQLFDTLSVADMLANDAGLAACSVLAHLADDQMDVDDYAAEARERVRWLASVSLRRAAIATLCDEQRSAFIEQWRRRAAAWHAERAAAPSAAPAAAAAADLLADLDVGVS